MITINVILIIIYTIISYRAIKNLNKVSDVEYTIAGVIPIIGLIEILYLIIKYLP